MHFKKKKLKFFLLSYSFIIYSEGKLHPSWVNTTPEDVQIIDGNQNSKRNVSHTDPKETIYADRLSKIKGVLFGQTCIQLTLQSLYNSHCIIIKVVMSI